VLAVGRVNGPYEFDRNLGFPHKRPVEWLLLDPWRMPDQEGLRTTVYELGRSATNLLELEQRLYRRDPAAVSTLHPVTPEAKPVPAALPPLDQFSARIEAILRRKGQVVLHGPPGTGKSYRALAVANELAARHAFQKSFADLTQPERMVVADGDGLVASAPFILVGATRTSLRDFGRRLSTAKWFSSRAMASSSAFAAMPPGSRTGNSSLFWTRSIAVTYPASSVN
jgi:5-methylcytosine-specific restriction enzyme B